MTVASINARTRAAALLLCAIHCLRCVVRSSSTTCCEAFALPRRSLSLCSLANGRSPSASAAGTKWGGGSGGGGSIAMSIGSDDFISRQTQDWQDQRTGVGRNTYSALLSEYEDGWRRRRQQQPRRGNASYGQPIIDVDYNDYNSDNGGGQGVGERYYPSDNGNDFRASQRRQSAYRQQKFSRDSRWPQQPSFQKNARVYQQRNRGETFGGRGYFNRRRANAIMANNAQDRKSVRGQGSFKSANPSESANDWKKVNNDINSNYNANNHVPQQQWQKQQQHEKQQQRQWQQQIQPNMYGQQIGFEGRRQEYDSRSNREIDPRQRWGQQYSHGPEYYDDSPYGYYKNSGPIEGGGYSMEGYVRGDRPLPSPRDVDVNWESQEFPQPSLSPPQQQYRREQYRGTGNIVNEEEFGSSFDADVSKSRDQNPYRSSPRNWQQYRDMSPLGRTELPTPVQRSVTRQIFDYYPPVQQQSQREQSSPGAMGLDDSRGWPADGRYDIPVDRVPKGRKKYDKSGRKQATPTGVGYSGLPKFAYSYLYPFGTDTIWSNDSASFSTAVKKSLADEKRTLERIVKDARRCMLNDSEVTEVFGKKLIFGAPFSKSSLSTNDDDFRTNGRGLNMSRYRLRLGVPVTGRGVGSYDKIEGSVFISADQDGITQLVVIVDGREIDVYIS